jgi:hypothetical protein
MYIFLKNYNLRCFVVSNGAQKSRCFGEENYQIPGGGGDIPSD